MKSNLLFYNCKHIHNIYININHKCLLFYRPFNLTDAELSSDNIKKSSLSDEPLIGTHDSILFEQKNYSLQIKPLGDINIKLEDIIPCAYKDLTFYIL